VYKVSEKVYRRERIGSAIAITATAISIYGSWLNSIALDHTMAMWVWQASNPLFMIWSFGFVKKWWDGGLSGVALCILYTYYTITNTWGLMHI
jgi:hypothetical protein